MSLAAPKGSSTIASRPRTGLLEQAGLWDTDVAPPADERGIDEVPLDQLAGFNPAIVNVRLATTAVSLVLAASGFATGQWGIVAAGVVIVSHTAYRSLVPLRYTGSPSDQAALLVEVVLFWVVLATTGFWRSPMVIASAAVLVVAGFAGGFRLALRIGAATTISLTVVGLAVTGWAPERMDEAVQWTTLLLLTAVIAGYGRRLSGEATRRDSANLDRITRLTDANNLLFNLHRVAQALPASLNRTEVLNSCLTQLRGLVDFERGVVLLLDEADRTWRVARHQAVDLAPAIGRSDLPAPARHALDGSRVAIQPWGGLQGRGFHPGSVGGIYAPLTARQRLIGLVAVETTSHTYQERDRQAMQAFTEPLALAIDNSTLFSHLRQVSVDEERSRIARDLHDRIGQSLASLGFDVDNVIRHHGQGRDIGGELVVLREGVRAATTEVREALYDLRSEVAEDKDFEHVMAEFAGRVAARSDLRVTIDSQTSTRLPLMQERELWRIAQEAVINVERHASASSVKIRWRCDREAAELTVEDDGRGMDAGPSGRSDSFGIVGMRERATSVGASLEIQSEPGEGTTVRCYLSQR